VILERLSKAAVVVSTCAAILCGAWLGAREWPPLLPVTVAAFAASWIAARRWRSLAWIPTLVIASILPAIFLLTRGAMMPAYWNIWLAGLLGAIAANMDVLRWTFPGRWKWPLAYWALVVAFTWPLIAVREADFSWAHFSANAVSGLGGSPPAVVVWILSVAAMQMLGLLFLDACITLFPLDDRSESRKRFERHVAWPIASGVIVGAMIAMYQGIVDIHWLSGHQWPYYNRASGSLDDGNAFGPLAGFWTGAFLALAAASTRKSVRAIAILGACAAGAGLWATGSRMALLAALICGAAALWAGVTSRRWSRRDIAYLGVPLICALALLSLFVVRSSTTSPIDRVVASMPSLSRAGITRFVSFELWNRFGPFGSAAVKMVRDYPVSGVGIGSFNHIFPDVAYELTGSRAHMDNAQSWYRHQLAEIGIIGSLGWLLWLPMLAVLLVRTRGEAARPFAALAIKSSLVAVAIVSAISLTQSFPVVLSVWVFVFWYLLLSPDAAAKVMQPAHLFGRRLWGAVAWILTVVVMAMTARTGWRELRPPYRAMRANWTYQVGFYGLETPGLAPPFRWTEQHALIVLPAKGPWLKLTIGGGPPDITERPIKLDVRRRGKLIASVKRSDASPVTWYVENATRESRMMLAFDVSRAWRASDYEENGDRRSLGVAVQDWTFVAAPPPGAVVIR
jgi:hypothetical protein